MIFLIYKEYRKCLYLSILYNFENLEICIPFSLISKKRNLLHDKFINESEYIQKFIHTLYMYINSKQM